VQFVPHIRLSIKKKYNQCKPNPESKITGTHLKYTVNKKQINAKHSMSSAISVIKGFQAVVRVVVARIL
jgi:hypothetical protein